MCFDIYAPPFVVLARVVFVIRFFHRIVAQQCNHMTRIICAIDIETFVLWSWTMASLFCVGNPSCSSRVSDKHFDYLVFLK